MPEPTHIESPDPHRGPYGCMTDDVLIAAYERVAVDPDNTEAPFLLAEMVHRGLACP
jgi:hypothetical protein